MKLQNQLTAAFTFLLVIILTVAGFVIYSLILDLLIQNEQRQLEQKGEILVNVLNERYETRQDAREFRDFLEEQELQLSLYARGQEVILISTLPDQVVTGFYPGTNCADTTMSVWESGVERCV